jgi:glucose/arabinose dehydrogenase
MTYLRAVWGWLLVSGFLSSASGAILDSNFTQTIITNAGAQITGIAFPPDGSSRLFVTRKTGQIAIVKNGSLLPTPFATVSPVFLNSECGLLGICFDRDFLLNGYVYVFATVSSSEQQIIRYTAVGDIGMNKTLLVTNLPTLGQNHDGGAIGIGPDNKLYWAIGDNGNGTGVNADLVSLAAKVGRANLDGTVPAGNPFADGPGGNNDFIWARGFRNPFTFTFQPSTGELWVNCVGTSYEQIFLVRATNHAGWNTYENNQPAGFITPRIKYRTGGVDTRTITASGAVRTNNIATFTTTAVHGFRQGERIVITGVSNASFNGTNFVESTPTSTTFRFIQPGPDAASGSGSATTMSQGNAVSGGCFYDSSAVPAAYRGNFFYGDYISGNFIRAILNATNGVSSVDYFGTGITNLIDIAVGPDGALYYAGHGGAIHRLTYNYAQQQLIVTPLNVRLNEGGTTTLNVRLAMAPTQDVQVVVARTSGDANIQVANGAALTFTPANWSVPQIVSVQAAHDLNSVNDTATLTVSASGLSSETVSVNALDLPLAPFSLGLISAQPGAVQIGLTGASGKTYVLEGNTSLFSNWTTVATQALSGSSTVLTDSVNFPLRFYRARLVP